MRFKAKIMCLIEGSEREREREVKKPFSMLNASKFVIVKGVSSLKTWGQTPVQGPALS